MVQGSLSLLIVVVSLFMTLITYLYVKNIFRKGLIPTAFLFFIVVYFTFCYIGATLLNVVRFDSLVAYGLYTNIDYLFNTWLYATLSLISFLLVHSCFIKYYKAATYLYSDTFVAFHAGNINEKRVYSFMVFFFLLSLAALFMYLNKLNFNVAILGVIKGEDFHSLSILRSNATNNFVGKAYRYKLFYQTLLQYVSFICFSYYLITTKAKSRWRNLFFLTFIGSVFVCVMNIEKAPVLFYFIGLLLVFSWAKRKIITHKQILQAAVLLSLVMVFMVSFFMLKGRGVNVVVTSLLNRMFLGQISGFFMWQEYLAEHGYLYGATLPNPHHVFPFVSQPIAVLVQAFSGLNTSGVKGSLTTVYWAEGFANFGVFGVVLWGVFFALIIGFFDAYFLKSLRKNSLNPIIISSYILIIMIIKNYATSGLSSILFDENLYSLLLTSFFIMSLCRVKRRVSLNPMVNN